MDVVATFLGDAAGATGSCFLINLPSAAVCVVPHPLQDMRTDELAGYTPYSVLSALVQQCKGKWDTAAVKCVRDVNEELLQLSKQVVNQLFGQYPKAEMFVR